MLNEREHVIKSVQELVTLSIDNIQEAIKDGSFNNIRNVLRQSLTDMDRASGMLQMAMPYNDNPKDISGHVYYACPPNCDKPHCQYCQGGLAYCVICKEGEAGLAEICPGVNLKFG